MESAAAALVLAAAVLLLSSTLAASGPCLYLFFAIFFCSLHKTRAFHADSCDCYYSTSHSFLLITRKKSPSSLMYFAEEYMGLLCVRVRFLRVPIGPADGAAAEGDRLLVRAGRGLHVHPLQRRLLQPKHRRLPLLLGSQQLLPEVQGVRRHLRLRRRRHPLLLRPQFLWMHFPFQCQCCWDNWHYHDDRHLEPWSRHRNRHQWHRDGERPEPAGHGQLRRCGGRLAPEG